MQWAVSQLHLGWRRRSSLTKLNNWRRPAPRPLGALSRSCPSLSPSCARARRLQTTTARRRVEMGAKFRRRLTENAFEHPVELGERLESNVVCDLADPATRVQ